MRSRIFTRSLFTVPTLFFFLQSQAQGLAPSSDIPLGQAASLHTPAPLTKMLSQQEVQRKSLKDMLNHQKYPTKNKQKTLLGFTAEEIVKQNSEDLIKILKKISSFKDKAPLRLIRFYDRDLALVQNDQVFYLLSDEETRESFHCSAAELYEDYVFLNKREKISYEKRYTLSYEEAVTYQKFLDSLDDAEQKKHKSLVELIGGKGASLSLLSSLEGVKTPLGLTIATPAYYQFIQETGLDRLIDSKLQHLDTGDGRSRDSIAEELQEAIASKKIPADIAKEIGVMYRLLEIAWKRQGKSNGQKLAVRSSGTKEDTADEVPWLSITTGSQAGQGDTFLDVDTPERALDKTKAVWASLFTARALDYRDTQSFLNFAGSLAYSAKGLDPEQSYQHLRELLQQRHKDVSDLLDPKTRTFPSTERIARAIEEELSHRNGDDAEFLTFVGQQLTAARAPFVQANELAMADVMMHMVKSYIAGVGFTVNQSTKNALRVRALQHFWDHKAAALQEESQHGRTDHFYELLDEALRFVYVEYQGQAIKDIDAIKVLPIFDLSQLLVVGEKPMIVSFQMNFGFGETVVSGTAIPDSVVMATTNGKDWFVLSLVKGAKEIQMINREEAKQLLPEKAQFGAEHIGKILEDVFALDLLKLILTRDVQKHIPHTYAKSNITEKAFSGNMSTLVEKMITDKFTEAAAFDMLQQFVNISEAADASSKSLTKEAVFGLIHSWFEKIQQAKKQEREGIDALQKEVFGKNRAKAERFKGMLSEIWRSKAAQRNELDAAILQDLGLGQEHFLNYAHVLHAYMEHHYTAKIETTAEHRADFTLKETAQLNAIARMIAAISRYKKKNMDIEFALELDKSAHPQEADVVTLSKELPPHPHLATGIKTLRVENVQGRPYTAPVLGIDYQRNVSEVDAPFLNGLTPIASGSQGEGAAWGYLYKFNPDQSIADQEAEIRRLKRGDFTEEERQDISGMGINPALYQNTGKEFPVLFYVEEADPRHNPLMSASMAVLTAKGGSTSHAAIFTRENRIPAVIGVGSDVFQARHLYIADSNNGKIYAYDAKQAQVYAQTKKTDGNGDIIVHKSILIKPYLIPVDEGDPKVGLIMAATKTAEEASALMTAKDAAGISLARAEFVASDFNINVIAGYAYDIYITKLHSHRPEGYQDLSADGKKLKLNALGLDDFDAYYVQLLLDHPWIIKEIQERLQELGYKLFQDMAQNNFHYFYNLLGMNIGEAHSNKSRSFDFSMDKVQGLIGSEVFARDMGTNPLVGFRGSALEVSGVENGQGGFQRILGFIYQALVDANMNTHNQAWFNVFVRTPDELRKLVAIILAHVDKTKKIPKQVGIMIEIPSNALYVNEFAAIMKDMERQLQQRHDSGEYASDFHGVFYSFGTNDYSNLTGKTDREDPRSQRLVMEYRAARNFLEKQDVRDTFRRNGYVYDVEQVAGRAAPLVVIRAAYEGAPAMKRMIGTVVHSSTDPRHHIDTSLCGEAINNLLAAGDIEGAAEIMAMLDSFGVSVASRLGASLAKFDAMRRMEHLKMAGAPDENIVKKDDDLFPEQGDLSKHFLMNKGVISGDCVVLNDPQDLIPVALRGLQGEELHAKKEELARNNPHALSVVGNKIVVMSKSFAETSLEYFKGQGLPWEDLQYARAILVETPHGEVPLMKKEANKKQTAQDVIRSRHKLDISADMRKTLSTESSLTLDFHNKKIYRGKGYAVERRKPEIKPIIVPAAEDVASFSQAHLLRPDQVVTCEGNNVLNQLPFHPRLLLEKERWGDVAVVTGYRNKVKIYTLHWLKRVQDIFQMKDAEKKAWFLKELRQELEHEPDAQVKKFVNSFIDAQQSYKSQDLDKMVEAFAEKYLETLEKSLDRFFKEKNISRSDIKVYLRGLFQQQIRQMAEKNSDKSQVLYNLCSFNAAEFKKMQGGLLFEEVSMNPDYGYRGPARDLGDLWELFEIELEAIHNVLDTPRSETDPKTKYPQLRIQVTELSGVQSFVVLKTVAEVMRIKVVDPLRAQGRLDHSDIVGIQLSTPADILSLGEYLNEHKMLEASQQEPLIGFVSLDKRSLAGAWLGVDIYAHQALLDKIITTDQLRDIQEKSERMVKGQLMKAGRPITLVDSLGFGDPDSSLDAYQALRRYEYGHNHYPDHVHFQTKPLDQEAHLDLMLAGLDKAEAARLKAVLLQNMQKTRTVFVVDHAHLELPSSLGLNGMEYVSKGRDEAILDQAACANLLAKLQPVLARLTKTPQSLNGKRLTLTLTDSDRVFLGEREGKANHTIFDLANLDYRTDRDTIAITMTRGGYNFLMQLNSAPLEVEGAQLSLLELLVLAELWEAQTGDHGASAHLLPAVYWPMVYYQTLLAKQQRYAKAGHQQGVLDQALWGEFLNKTRGTALDQTKINAAIPDTASMQRMKTILMAA